MTWCCYSNELSLLYTTTVLRPFVQDHLGEPVPEENFWTLWCKGRLTEADTPTIRLGATPCRLTSAPSIIPPFLQAGCPSSLPAAQPRVSKHWRLLIPAIQLMQNSVAVLHMQMRPIVTDRAAWSVCRSLCQSVTLVSSVKTTELIEMPFGLSTWAGPGNHVLDGVQIPPWKGQFWGGWGEKASRCKVWGHYGHLCKNGWTDQFAV